jgi:hypothetical protein
MSGGATQTNVEPFERPHVSVGSNGALAIAESSNDSSDDPVASTFSTYPQDAFERWLLFLDTLRERANNVIAHEQQGLPPLLRAATSPASAEALRDLHPMRWTRTMFSERVNPWMHLVKSAAETVRETRIPLPDDHPSIQSERALVGRTAEVMGAWRKERDAWIAHVFGAMFGAYGPAKSPRGDGQLASAANKE